MIELIAFRDKLTKRETRLVGMLQVSLPQFYAALFRIIISCLYQYISTTVWKHIFNKAADSLERSTENEDECKLL